MCSTCLGNPQTQTLYACFQSLFDCNPLKYLMEKPVEDGKTAKWVLLLLEFDIKYVTQKSVKGRAITDHLAHCSPKEAEEIQGDFRLR